MQKTMLFPYQSSIDKELYHFACLSENEMKIEVEEETEIKIENE